MAYIVRLGPTYFPDASRNRPIRYGRIYVGVHDTDPTDAANQQTVTALLEDGTEVALSQPILTSAGGVPVYNGSPVSLKVADRYSLSVINQNGELEYYVASNYAQDDDEIEIISGSLECIGLGEIPVNDSGADCNFRVETSISDRALFIDGGTGEVVFNDTGSDTDFRVESDINANTLFIDGTYNTLGIGTGNIETWGAAQSSIQIGGNSSITSETAPGAGNELNIYQNAYINAAGFVAYQDTDEASCIRMINGIIQLNCVASGTADSGIAPWTEAYRATISENVFNEGGEYINFRVESQTDANAFFVDGIAGCGIGTSDINSWNQSLSALQLGRNTSVVGTKASDANGEVYINFNCWMQLVGTWLYQIDGIASQYYQEAGEHLFRTAISGTANNTISWIDLAKFSRVETVFNDGSADIDFRIESDTNTHAFFLKGSSGFIGINTSDIHLWASGYDAVQIGGFSAITARKTGEAFNDINLISNAYRTNVGWFYKEDGAATSLSVGNGGLTLNAVSAGTADNPITWLIPFTATYDEVVVNTNAADIDFRAESTANTHALFMEASTGNIGIGTSSFGSGTGGIIAITESTAPSSDPVDAGFLWVDSSDEYLYYRHSSGAVSKISPFTGTESGDVVFNESGGDWDFRVESSVDENAIRVDGLSGGISFYNVYSQLECNGTNVVINSEGEDIDFRVASDINTRSLFLEGSSSNATFNKSSVDAWSATVNAVQMGNTASFMYLDSGIHFLQNAYYDAATNYIYQTNDTASAYEQNSGDHIFYSALSGTATNPVTFVETFRTGLFESVFNDDGADIDFRIESDTNANAFFLEGSSGNIGLSKTSLDTWDSTYVALQIGGNASLLGNILTGVGKQFYILQNAWYDGSWKYQSADEATRLHSTSGSHFFSTATAGALANDPITWIKQLELGQSGTIFNDDGADIDFRIESDTNTHAFFLEGSSSNIGINTTDFGGAGPGTGVIGIASGTAPTSDPTSGVVLYSDSADDYLKCRDVNGDVTQIAPALTYYSHGSIATGTVTPDLDDGFVQYINCTGSFTLANPTNIPSYPVEFTIIIDKADFSDYISFGTDFKGLRDFNYRQIVIKMLYVSGSIVKTWQENSDEGIAKLWPDSWNERTTALTPSDAGASDRFGRACALSDDGTVLAVGAFFWDGGAGADQGAMYIFDWTGSSWSERTTALTASDAGANDRFGSSCSLSDDGTVLAVGAFYWDGGAGANQGAVYIFDWTGSSWSERTTALTPSDAGADDQFGISCSLSDDGTVLAVGAYQWDGGAGAGQGAMYIFDWTGSSWSERTTALTPSDAGASDGFGTSCSLSDNGTVLAVGAYAWDGGAGSNQGAVYIFDWTGSSWSERTTALTPSDAGDIDGFGISCSLSDDGTVLAVGAYFWDGGAATNQGAMYIFDWTGSSWSERTTALTPSDAGDDQFGISCALSDDGTVLAVGSYAWDGGAGADQGAVYVFDLVDYLGSVH